jgi:hypothetical protein
VIKPLLALFAVAGLCVAASACGSSGRSTSPSSHVSSSADPDDEVRTSSDPKAIAPTDYAKLHGNDPDDEGTPIPRKQEEATTNYAKVDGDKDNDVGAAFDDTNNNLALRFGHAAGAGDRRTITALVKRYFAVALAGDAVKGCAMLYSTLAEAAAEDYGVPGGPEYVRGAKTCQAVLSGVFRHYHARLAVEVPKLAVTHVRLQGRQGYAFLSFAPFPERELVVTREGRVWKIGAFLDGELP